MKPENTEPGMDDIVDDEKVEDLDTPDAEGVDVAGGPDFALLLGGGRNNVNPSP